MKKAVLITGGSRGIGAAAVRKFSEAGDAVAFIYEQNKEAAEKLCEETGAVAIRCDVADDEAVAKAVKDAKVLLGVSAFDAVVCNAAISENGLFLDTTIDQWKRIINVNQLGTINVTNAVLKDMINVGKGSIIMISSIWGQTGASCEVAYSTTKAAIIGLTKSLAKEMGPSGIRVNCVAPGVIDTDMNKQHSQETMEALCQEVPLNRIGTPKEVAEVIYFLSGEGASYITGQIIGVNGGFLI
ncbi:3-oxoacyl-[acyl-carrier protein] reductase [Clostridiales Family XIII bacterium PM5-7]